MSIAPCDCIDGTTVTYRRGLLRISPSAGERPFPAAVRVIPGPGRVEFHCFRHGLSWAHSAGVDDFGDVPGSWAEWRAAVLALTHEA